MNKTPIKDGTINLIKHLFLANAVMLMLIVIGVPFIALSKETIEPKRIIDGQYPATVDIAKGYVLVTLTSTNDVPKFLEKGYHLVAHGNFADYQWPSGTLPFYASDGFWDPNKPESTGVPAKFILPLYLEVDKHH